ncbi:MAG: NYN domain-containing protein [Nocardioides sp.]
MADSSAVRMAVLIDADNTSASHAGALLEEVARYGVPTVKRAYGDWTTQQLVGWKKALNQHAIQPVQQFAYTQGKNSTDSALIIDAMDLLYSGNLEAFAIVSSDSDFTRLATRLRESGKTVYGLGRRRTPPSLVAACDKFIYLEVLGDPGDDEEATGAEPAAEEQAPLPDLQKLLTSAIDATSDDDGWAHLGSVGSYLGSSQSSFDPRNYGFGKLVTLARAQDYVEVEEREDHVIRVRLVARPSSRRRGGHARKRTAAKE